MRWEAGAQEGAPGAGGVPAPSESLSKRRSRPQETSLGGGRLGGSWALEVPGQSCCRKVYVATSRAAELDSPPPRGTELTTTALKPGSGAAAGEAMGEAQLRRLGGRAQGGMYCISV